MRQKIEEITLKLPRRDQRCSGIISFCIEALRQVYSTALNMSHIIFQGNYKLSLRGRAANKLPHAAFNSNIMEEYASAVLHI